MELFSIVLKRTKKDIRVLATHIELSVARNILQHARPPKGWACYIELTK